MTERVDWSDPDVPCQVCGGLGQVEVQDPSNLDRPSTWAECGYCHGAKNNLWRGEKRRARVKDMTAKARRVRKWLIPITVILLLSNSHPVSATVNLVKFLIWLPVLAGWVWYWINRPPSKRDKARAQQGPNPMPFTDNSERLAVAAIWAGGFLKAGHDVRARQQRDQLNRIEQQVNKNLQG